MSTATHERRYTLHEASQYTMAATRRVKPCFSLFGLAGMLCVLLTGCALLGGVDVEPVATSVQKPSNVAVYVSVRDSEKPVESLTAQSFKLFENNQSLSPEESKLTLLNRDLAVTHHVLVLLDMSNANETVRRRTGSAVAGFVTRARSEQGVTVCAFDGSSGIHTVGEYSRTADRSEELEQIDALVSYSPGDPSRDLHGAIDSGLRELDARLMNGRKPVRVGTLVVFSRGPDLAGRIKAEQLDATLRKTRHHIVTIGIGKTDGDDYLEDIGKDGVIRAQDKHTLGIAFEDAATKVKSLFDMYYLVSYCSPARAGMRRLRLEVEFTTLQGEEKSGSLEHDFDATGFGPGCNPSTAPRFVIGSSSDGQIDASPAEQPAEPAATPDAGPEAAPDEKAPARATKAPKSDAPKADSDDEVVPPPQKRGYAPHAPE